MQKCGRGRTFLPTPTVRIENTADLQDRRFKVQEKTDSKVCRPEIAAHLSVVDLRECLDGLQFDNDTILDQKVQSMFSDRSFPERD